MQKQTTPAITLPKPGNYDYLELPLELQQLILAVHSLDDASAALDSAERATREKELSDDPTERAVWRWYQDTSLLTYKLHQQAEMRAQLAYVGWLIEREREEGHGSRAQLAALTNVKLRLLLAQEA